MALTVGSGYLFIIYLISPSTKCEIYIMNNILQVRHKDCDALVEVIVYNCRNLRYTLLSKFPLSTKSLPAPALCRQ